MAGVGPALVSDRSVQELLLVVDRKLARDQVRLVGLAVRQHGRLVVWADPAGRKLAPDQVRLVGLVIRQDGRVVVWVGLVGRRLAQMPRRHRDSVVSAGRQHSVPGNLSRLNQRSPQRRLLLLAEVPRRADSLAQPI